VERWTHGKQPESAGVRAATAGNGGDGKKAMGAAPTQFTESARGATTGGATPRISVVGREYTGISPTPEKPPAMPPPGATTDDGEALIDWQRLEDTSMGIAALRGALVGAFLNDVGPRVDRLSEAIQARDPRRIEFEAQ